MPHDLDAAVPAPLIAEALDMPGAEILDWRVVPVGRGVSLNGGVSRVPGTDRDRDGVHPRSMIREWSIGDYGRASRHLGQFHGACLDGQPPPRAETWLRQGRTGRRTAWVPSALDDVDRHERAPAADRFRGGDTLARLRRIWTDPEPVLRASEGLPACFCHHEAFRRTLMARRTDAGVEQTVAIDRAFIGFGRVGEEAGVTMANAVAYTDVPGSRGREVDEAGFTGYVNGLREVGWHGDVRGVRLAYAYDAALMTLDDVAPWGHPYWEGAGPVPV